MSASNSCVVKVHLFPCGSLVLCLKLRLRVERGRGKALSTGALFPLILLLIVSNCQFLCPQQLCKKSSLFAFSLISVIISTKNVKDEGHALIVRNLVF